jgi:hypothetical protein
MRTLGMTTLVLSVRGLAFSSRLHAYLAAQLINARVWCETLIGHSRRSKLTTFFFFSKQRGAKRNREDPWSNGRGTGNCFCRHGTRSTTPERSSPQPREQAAEDGYLA